MREAIRRSPNFLPPHGNPAVAYSTLGRDAEAQAEVAEVLRINPKFSLEMLRQVAPIKAPAQFEWFFAALRKVGLK